MDPHCPLFSECWLYNLSVLLELLLVKVCIVDHVNKKTVGLRQCLKLQDFFLALHVSLTFPDSIGGGEAWFLLQVSLVAGAPETEEGPFSDSVKVGTKKVCSFSPETPSDAKLEMML